MRIFVMLTMVGCGPTECPEGTVIYADKRGSYCVSTDGDGDGFDAVAYGGGDCDDADPAYHPGADESDCADPNDYNCDGSVGPDDIDNDGWIACTECDDANANVYPAATEVCDGFDNNCNGLVDLDDPYLDRSTLGQFFIDVDGDGYGDASTSIKACESPDGYIATGDDCDDANAVVNPEADEVCDNAVDDDCDGEVDDCGDGGGEGEGEDASTFCDGSVWCQTFYEDVSTVGFSTVAPNDGNIETELGTNADWGPVMVATQSGVDADWDDDGFCIRLDTTLDRDESYHITLAVAAGEGEQIGVALVDADYVGGTAPIDLSEDWSGESLATDADVGTYGFVITSPSEAVGICLGMGQSLRVIWGGMKISTAD